MFKPKINARIEKWVLRDSIIHGDKVLVGEIFGHPNFAEGTEVRTSRIICAEGYEDGKKVETLNTIYTLGEPASKNKKI